MYTAYEFRLVHGGQGVQVFFVKEPVAAERSYCKIPHTERCQVLEKVCPLRRVHTVLFQAAFHYCTCATDMRPLYRDTQPRVAATPPSGTDEYITVSFFDVFAVQFLYLAGYKPVVLCVEIIAFYI